MEQWKNIADYEGQYMVSNLGRVKSLGNDRTRKEKLLAQVKTDRGYTTVNLFKNGKEKKHYVHRLVAMAFIPNPTNLPQVNHKDEDKTNNRVDNLEWCIQEFNINYGTRNKRIAMAQSKQVLCVETGVIYPSTQEVERQLGFANTHIGSCCNGKLKTAYGYTWKYVD